MATRKTIRISRRGAATGTAVAAALLALNIGGGYLLLSGDAKPENSMVATNELDEQTGSTQPTASELPLYVTKMQEYYTAISGIPCDFDFTGYGEDIDYNSEDENYRLTLNAITGCDWVLYYFFDVEPLQGQDWEQFQSDFPTIILEVDMSDVLGGDYECTAASITTMPNQDKELDDGVWHCVGMISNRTDIPFSADGNALSITTKFSPEKDNGSIGRPVHFFTFLTNQPPLQETDQPWYYNAKEFYTGEGSVWEAENGYPVVELNRLAATPFGVFYVSQVYQTNTKQGFHMTGYHPDLLDMSKVIQADFTVSGYDGEIAIDTFEPARGSYCGTTDRAGQAISYIHVLFDHPWDSAKGALCIARHDGTAEESAPDTADTADTTDTAEAALQITDAETGEFIQPTQEQLDSLTHVEKGALVVLDAYWHRDVQIEAELQADGTVQLNYCNLLPKDVGRVNGDCELLISVSYNGEVIPIYNAESNELHDSLTVMLTHGADISVPFWLSLSDIVGEDVNVTETYPLEISLMYRPLVTLGGEQNTKYFCAVKTYTLTNGG